MWKFIGNILKNNSNKESSITELKIGNKNITDQNVITKEFNTYFANIGKNLASQINSNDSPES